MVRKNRRAARQSPSRVDLVLRELKQRIADGRYPPGTPLSESQLARDHDASRTPVREALSRLVQEGYVQRLPGRGYLVTPITVRLIQDTFEVRRVLEGAAAARAAADATEGEIAQLRQLAEFRYAVGDAASYRSAQTYNRNFHMAVVAASHNALIVDLVRHCLTQMERFMSLGVNFDAFQGGASVEHNEIVDAIAARTADAARAAMERHLDRSTTLLMRALVRGEIPGLTV